MISEMKKQAMTLLRALLARRHVIICAVAIAAIAGAIWLLVPMIPHTAKPQHYNVGELSIKAITEVVGYRKVTAVSQSLSGTGRAEAGSYSYQAGKEPHADVEAYSKLLQEQYKAVMGEESQSGSTEGKLTFSIPTGAEDTFVELIINYSPESYTVTVDEKKKIKEKPVDEKKPINVTSDQARELLMSLTKQETGFTADISVYTTNLEPDTVMVEDWEYYVFTVVADYSATRIEYRGTFYVGCTDGIMLRYDKETGTTSRLRGPMGETEAVKTE